MQRGTAALMKRMKCFELPTRTVMSSPSGIHFRVRATDRVDAYTIIIHGTVLPVRDTVTTLNVDDVTERQSELEKTNTEGFLWPTCGWDVLHIGQLDLCHEPEYVGQYITAPYHARVSVDKTMDSLLFAPRRLHIMIQRGK